MGLLNTKHLLYNLIISNIAVDETKINPKVILFAGYALIKRSRAGVPATSSRSLIYIYICVYPYAGSSWGAMRKSLICLSKKQKISVEQDLYLDVLARKSNR